MSSTIRPTAQPDSPIVGLGTVAWVLLLMLATTLTAASSAAAEHAPEPQQAPAPADGERAPQGGAAGDTEEAGEAGEAGEVAEAELSLDERLDLILTEVLSQDEYREQISCLRLNDFKRVRIINEDFMLFSKRDKHYLNKLKNSCRGIKQRMTITTLTSGVRSLCRNEIVYASNTWDLQHGFLSNGRPAMVQATCVLGDFELINEQQAMALMGVE